MSFVKLLNWAKKGKIKHQVHKFPLSKVNEAIDLLRAGRIEGRAVIIP
jgi:D-arabinose 1-dehydrogenase-like Zn-dependent alcohol dehydrogenase